MKAAKKVLVALSSIIVMLALLAWIAIEVFDLSWRRHPPLEEQLLEGKWIVRRVEEFKAKHGRYPNETEAAKLVPGKIMVDSLDPDFDPEASWYYSAAEQEFTLTRYTGKTGEMLWYSDEYAYSYPRSDPAFKERRPRWYLRVEGGKPYFLPDE